MSATTDCVSSPVWILFAKNLSKSAVRRNSFSQSGVKVGLPMDPTACGPASAGLSTTGALRSLAFSPMATGFICSLGICATTNAPTTTRYSGTSTNKSVSCRMTHAVTAPSPNPGSAHHTDRSCDLRFVAGSRRKPCSLLQKGKRRQSGRHNNIIPTRPRRNSSPPQIDHMDLLIRCRSRKRDR